MRKLALIIYGPPGAGKGTQAELASRKLGFIHFDTGRYIEALLRSKEAESDPILKRERINFDTGKLCTPAWVLKITKEAAAKIAKVGQSIVFSGSPRTIFEAFGEPGDESAKLQKDGGLIEVLEKLYGKKNIIVIRLRIPESESIKRNSRRVVCSVCGLPVLSAAGKIRACAFCGGLPRTRTLDNPAVIKVRLKEFEERTYPILKRLKSRGYAVCEIDASPAPYKVFEIILKKVSSRVGV